MKALKEKRASLRSLFRGSLAILSILALAFAFAACGSSSDDDNGGGGGGGGGGTVEPDPVKAVSIAILQQPQYESFLGCPPNLKGLIAHVRFSDGTDKVIGDDHPDFGKLFTLPGYCDEPSDIYKDITTGAAFSDTDEVTAVHLASFAKTYMQLGYRDGMVYSSQLVIPLVVQSDALQVTGPSVTDWFSDQRPDYSGLAYEIIVYERKLNFDATVLLAKGYSTLQDWRDLVTGDYHEWGMDDSDWDAGFDNTTDGARKLSGKYQKFTMPMTASYPKYDMTLAKKQHEIVVWIGPPYAPYTPATYPIIPEVINDLGFTPGINFAGAGRATSFAIQNFWEVSGVEFASASFGNYFDDQAAFFGARWINDAGNVRGQGNFAIDIDKAILAVMDAQPKFKVFYFGGKSREINLDEFLGNNSYYVVELGFDTSVFHGISPTLTEAGGSIGGVSMANYAPKHAVVAADSVREFITAPYTPRPASYPRYVYDSEALGDGIPNTAILNVDDDTGTWNITLEYVPAYYLDVGVGFGGAWVSHVDVPFPIYVFDDQIEVRPIASAGLNHIRMVGLNYLGTNDTGDLPTYLLYPARPAGTTPVVPDPFAPSRGGIYGIAGMSDGQLQAINDKWDLIGSYSRGSDRKERVIPFTKRHFYDGNQGRSRQHGGLGNARSVQGNASYYTLSTINEKGTKAATIFGDIFRSNGVPQSDAATGIAASAANQLPVGVVGRDWPLAVYYRGQFVDNEETVLIDIIGP